MRRISFGVFGGPEVLRLDDDAQEPHAAPGQVRVAVRAAGVNPVDWRFREGQRQAVHPVELPAGIGQDAAGVVDEIGGPGAGDEDGEDGADVRVGDRVFGRGTGTYAELAVLDSWARMPEGLAFDEAAGYPSVVETALRVLDQIGVRPGETVLVSGAAGGVGSAILQIARDRGVGVVGTASEPNQDYLRSLGARAATYGEGWVERVRRLGRVDAAVDVAGAGVVGDLVELTGDPDRVVSIADLDAPRAGVRFSTSTGDAMPRALATAADLIARGRLHIPVARSYPLTEAAAAQSDSKAGHTAGRRVIVLDR